MELKIGVISAHPYVEEIFSNLESDTECELLFKIGILDMAQTLALQLQEEDKVDAIITVGVPMEVFKKSITTPIYPIYPSNYDIINALYKAHNLGKKMAFAEMPFKSVYYDFAHISEILGYDITHYQFSAAPLFSNKENVENIVQQAINDGRDVFVTMGGYSHTYAQSLGLPSVLVMPEVQTFQATLENVKRKFLVNLVEEEKIRWLNAVFDNAKEGVLVLDHMQKAVVINQSAQKFMHLDQSEVEGKKINEIQSSNPLFLKFFNTSSNFEVVRSRTREYYVKKEILYDGDIPLGTVIRANPVKEIQKMEMNTRLKLNDDERGFIAKNTFADIKGNSQMFQEIKEKAKRYAKSNSNIILYGESGSGKEIFAQSIHNTSLCKDGPFVAINCTVLSETLLESELFGYEDGAFTGAKKGGKPGLFEMAHKGTLFLDEIGDMPSGIQVKLLRVLQERTIRRIGGSKNIPVEVRFIFATNRNLLADTAAGIFRKDLYYRINVLFLQIPPLREHIEDLKDISQDILKNLSSQTGKFFTLSKESIGFMQKYDWPGNVRELNNFLERASFLERQDEKAIDDMIYDLMQTDEKRPDPEAYSPSNGGLTLEMDTLHNMENAIIHALYKRYDGDRKRIKNILEISTSSLYRRLKELDISK